ncbi:MAG: plasmid pRiA4b ORF-3 family protein [Bacteroidota bacterium]
MSKLYQIKIQLEEITPSIWRRVVIPSDMLLSDFHKVIQTVMGWENSHLHQFIKDETFYLPRMKDDWTWNEMNNVDYKRWKVSGLLKKENDAIVYEYDFGDSWRHSILLEEITDNPRGRKTPLCLDGERNCPPEDCGGVWGYEHLLKVIKDPSNEEYDDMMSWIDEEFDPEKFSVTDVNLRLKRKDFGQSSFW